VSCVVAPMIIIAVGANIEGAWGSPRQTVERAFAELDQAPLRVVSKSQLIITAPFGRTDQPDFVNAAVVIETELAPEGLLSKLHEIEQAAGRVRSLRWGPRTLDLDIIDYHGQIIGDPETQLTSLVLPHPGAATRDFVLKPIAEIAPHWRHPILRRTAAKLLG
jgi:2-amino-4-hydroxy-6-hydroxymethyldihydropteridine diphosphokinase